MVINKNNEINCLGKFWVLSANFGCCHKQEKMLFAANLYVSRNLWKEVEVADGELDVA